MSLDDIPEIVVICTQYNGMGLLWWVGGGIGHIKIHAEECEGTIAIIRADSFPQFSAADPKSSVFPTQTRGNRSTTPEGSTLLCRCVRW